MYICADISKVHGITYQYDFDIHISIRMYEYRLAHLILILDFYKSMNPTIFHIHYRRVNNVKDATDDVLSIHARLNFYGN